MLHVTGAYVCLVLSDTSSAFRSYIKLDNIILGLQYEFLMMRKVLDLKGGIGEREADMLPL